MNFQNWISSNGRPVGVGLKLRIEPARIRAWLSGRACPQVTLMRRLVEAGKGAFTYEDIILETKGK